MRQAIAQSGNYKWWVFLTVALGIFMSVVDELSLLVALPTIESDFNVDLPTGQWVVLGYALTVSVFLLPMGRLADIRGRKQVYVTGFVIFVVGAALAGLSTHITMLIMSKVLQGAGAAMIQGNGIALLIAVFPERERGKVLGYILGAVGIGAITGPALGGFLASSALSWRGIFVIDVLVGTIGLAAAVIILDKSKILQDTSGGQRPKFDWLGAILSGGALLAFLLVMTYGGRTGWDSVPIVAGFLACVLLLATFIWWELRTTSPLLELRLFKRRLLALGVMSGWISFLGSYSLLFMMPFYLQKVLGFTPEKAGLMLVPGFICLTVLGPISGRLSDRIGWRKLNMAGLAMSATALFIMATRLTETSSLALVIPVLMLQMAGGGLFDSPNNSSILSAVEPYRYGVASALTQLMRTSAGVTTIALSTAIVVATMASMNVEPKLEAVSAGGRPEIAHAFVSGLRTAFFVLGSVVVVGIIVSFLKGERARAAPSPQARVSESPSD